MGANNDDCSASGKHVEYLDCTNVVAGVPIDASDCGDGRWWLWQCSLIEQLIQGQHLIE